MGLTYLVLCPIVVFVRESTTKGEQVKIKVGALYRVEHKYSTMATLALVKAIDGDAVEIMGDHINPKYVLTAGDWDWSLVWGESR